MSDKTKVHKPEVLLPQIEIEDEVEIIRVPPDEHARAVAYAKNLWLAMGSSGQHVNSANNIILAMEGKFGWSPERRTIYHWAKKRWVQGELTWRQMWDMAKQRGLTKAIVKQQENGTVKFDDGETLGTDNAQTIINLLTKDISAMMTTNSKRRELYGEIELYVLGQVINRMKVARLEVERIKAKFEAGEELDEAEKKNALDGGLSLEYLLELIPIGNLKSGFESACKIFSERELMEHVKNLADTTADEGGTLLEILEVSGKEKATGLITKLSEALMIADKSKGKR